MDKKPDPKKIAIIGAGFTGLTLGFVLSKKGYAVDIFEQSDHLGGLAAGYRQNGWYVDYFYRHIFKTDTAIISLAKEIGFDRWIWKSKNTTSTYYNNRIYPFNGPFDLLNFTPLPLLDRIRTGIFSLYLKLKSFPRQMQRITAEKWIKKYMGQKSYNVIWKPLFAKKFHHFSPSIAMIWLWARLNKRSASLGHPEGGFEGLAWKISAKITSRDGTVILNSKIASLKPLLEKYNSVIYTGPVKELPGLFDFEKEYREKCLDRDNLGAVVMTIEYKGKKLLKNNYWINLNSGKPEDVVCVVNHTDFISSKHYGGKQILYTGGYFPQNHNIWEKADKSIYEDWIKTIEKLDKSFSRREIAGYHIFRAKYAQPVFDINYREKILPFKTPLQNLYLVSMDQVYPYDRGVNYAVAKANEFVAKENL